MSDKSFWDMQIKDVKIFRRAVIVVLFPLVLVLYAITGFFRGIGVCIEEAIDLW